MRIVEDDEQLDEVLQEAIAAAPGQPLLVDRFLEDAYEADVDAIGDGERVVIGAMMQHIEEAGIHSGDSACVLPPYHISLYHLEHDARIHRADRVGAGRARADECAVCDQGRHCVRARSQPARLTHRAVR